MTILKELLNLAPTTEAIAPPFKKFKAGQKARVKKTGQEVTVMGQNEIGLVFTRAGDATQVDPNQKTVYAKGYQEYMPTELELCEAVLTRSNAELDLREKMISKIEGFFGELQSLRFDLLDTKDTSKMYFGLLDSALINPIKIDGKYIRREEDLEAILK